MSGWRQKRKKTGLGLRLTLWREHREQTQEALAAQINVAVGLLVRYEGNHTVPGGKVLSRLAIDGLNINWLLTGVGAMTWDGASPPIAAPLTDGIDAFRTWLNSNRLALRQADPCIRAELQPTIERLDAAKELLNAWQQRTAAMPMANSEPVAPAAPCAKGQSKP